jgi:hypothetical protein
MVGVDSLVSWGALAARLRAGRGTATSSSLKSRAFVIPYPLHPFIADCSRLVHYSPPLWFVCAVQLGRQLGITRVTGAHDYSCIS